MLIRILTRTLFALVATLGLLLASWVNANPEAVRAHLPRYPLLYWALSVMVLYVGLAMLIETLRSEIVGRMARRSKGTMLIFTISSMAYIAGIFSIGLIYWSMGSVIHLELAREPSTLERKRAEVSLKLRPTAMPAASGAAYPVSGSLYHVRASYPSTMYLNEDGLVEIYSVVFSSQLMKLLYPPPSDDPEEPSMRIDFSTPPERLESLVELTSNSFTVNPIGGLRVPLAGEGPRLKFMISPRETGRRKLRLRSQLAPETSKFLGVLTKIDHSASDLEIEVLPERYLLGLSIQQLKALQLFTSSIGLPSAAVLLLGMLINYVKESRGRERSVATNKSQRGPDMRPKRNLRGPGVRLKNKLSKKRSRRRG